MNMITASQPANVLVRVVTSEFDTTWTPEDDTLGQLHAHQYLVRAAGARRASRGSSCAWQLSGATDLVRYLFAARAAARAAGWRQIRPTAGSRWMYLPTRPAVPEPEPAEWERELAGFRALGS
jgi:hypothetical protein